MILDSTRTRTICPGLAGSNADPTDTASNLRLERTRFAPRSLRALAAIHSHLSKTLVNALPEVADLLDTSPGRWARIKMDSF